MRKGADAINDAPPGRVMAASSRAGKSAVPARRESDVQDYYGAFETLRHALGRR